MDDRFNTIAGWVLGAGIVALGASIVTGEVFHAERPEKMGYPIAGMVEESESGAPAEQPIAAYLAAADPAKGEAVFAKCTACHNVAPGGANALGPNIHGIMGAALAAKPGFAYSDALKAKGGRWDWETMSAWLKSPRTFADGTKMTFAGLSKPEDRANLMVWMNAQGSNIPLPPPPVAAGNPAQVAAEKADLGAPGKAADAPVQSESQAGAQPAGNIGGDAATSVAGRGGQEKAK